MEMPRSFDRGNFTSDLLLREDAPQTASRLDTLFAESPAGTGAAGGVELTPDHFTEDCLSDEIIEALHPPNRVSEVVFDTHFVFPFVENVQEDNCSEHLLPVEPVAGVVVGLILTVGVLVIAASLDAAANRAGILTGNLRNDWGHLGDDVEAGRNGHFHISFYRQIPSVS